MVGIVSYRLVSYLVPETVRNMQPLTIQIRAACMRLVTPCSLKGQIDTIVAPLRVFAILYQLLWLSWLDLMPSPLSRL